jgi:hypothetical protein
MKDCKFLLPFVDELRKLYPDHKIEWYRNEFNTEYEEIKIDGVRYINTNIGYHSSDIDDKEVFHANIEVHFSNINTKTNYDGLIVDDPYSNLVPPVILEIFSDHQCLREIFNFLLSDNADYIKKRMANLIKLDKIKRDF